MSAREPARAVPFLHLPVEELILPTLPPCRNYGIGHPGLKLGPENTAVCPGCKQELAAYLNDAGEVTFNMHYPPEKKQHPKPARSDRRR